MGKDWMSDYRNDVRNELEMLGERQHQASEETVLSTLPLADALEAVRRSEALHVDRNVFRQLVEHIREVFWVTDVTKKRLIYISPGYETIWGRSCASLYASPESWLEGIHPEDRERVREASVFKQVLGEYNETYRILRPDGSVRWIQDRAFVVRDDAGEVERVVGVAEDITLRKLAEEAKRGAEANYRSLFENAMEGIFQTTPEGRYLSANPALARMLGYASPEELISSITNLGQELCVRPETREELGRQLETADFVEGFENEIYRKDRSRIWVRINVRSVRDAGGKILHYQGTSQDITKRKEAEAQLAMLGHGVESTTEPICITDLQNRFTFVNRAFQKTYGYREEEILGKSPEILYSPRNPPHLLAEILRETHKGGWRGEVLDLRKDGTEFPIFLSTSQIKDQSSEVIGLMGVAQDITERKRGERQGEAFVVAGRRLSMATTPHQAAEIIFGTVSELFDWDVGAVSVCSPGQSGLTLVLKVDRLECQMAGRNAQAAEEPGPLLSRIIETGACLLDGDEISEAGDLLLLPAKKGLPGSAMVVPIHSGGNLFGIFSLQSHAANVYSKADLKFVKGLADYCGGALRRIKLSDSLRESERKLRLIAENTTDAVFAFDMRRKLLYANHAVKDLTGYTVEELQGWKSIDWFHPDDRKRMLQHWDDLYLGKSYADEEFRLITRDGQQKWCSGTWGPLLDEDGRQIGVQGRERDITQLRQVQAARRELAAIVENAQDAIFSVTLDGRLASWNNAAERIYGYTAQEAVGQPIAILLSADCAAKVAGILENVVGGNTLENYEVVHRKKDGSPVTVSLTVSPVRDDCGNITWVSIIARDVTQRIQLEQEILETSAGERRRIGHELHDGLGQFLAGIAFRAKALEQTLAAEGLPCIREARELTTLISNAIGQTRSLARGLDPIEVENRGLIIALQDLAAETEKLFGVRCLFASRVPDVQVDGQAGLAFYRIMQEAIHNAIKHGSARRIQTELKYSDDHLCLEIQDDGAGFDAGATGAGCGMGLRVMNYRARSIGAVLLVKSQPERGTRIECRLPVAAVRPAHD